MALDNPHFVRSLDFRLPCVIAGGDAHPPAPETKRRGQGTQRTMVAPARREPGHGAIKYQTVYQNIVGFIIGETL